jgi:parallel beta-helix repeat protein
VVSIIPSSGFFLVNKLSTLNSNGTTLYVGGNGAGNYSSIQAAINDSSPGDTVFVYNDSSPYNEYVRINKMIKLIGEDRDTTIINGNYFETVFISPGVDNVLISGFTITGGMYGIDVCSDNNVIQANKIVFNSYGIEISANADYNIITNNIIIHNSYVGIYDGGDYSGSTVTWNFIADNGYLYSDGLVGGLYKLHSYGYYHHNDFYLNLRNAHVSGSWGNTWDDGSEGNYWDDWEKNPGYPDVYIISGSWEDEIDRYPSSTPYIDHPIVTIDYDYYGGVNELIDFSAIHVDPSFVSWFWEFGDGATSNETCPKHVYSKPGTFHINLTVTNDQGISDTDKGTAYIGEPPNKPTISGPTTGKNRELLKYSIVATDPDGGNLYYDINWGDYGGDDIGPYPAGEVVNVSHRWYWGGTFTIGIKAIDEAGFESDYATINVTITKSKDVNLNLLIFELLEKCPSVQKLLHLLK